MHNNVTVSVYGIYLLLKGISTCWGAQKHPTASSYYFKNHVSARATERALEHKPLKLRKANLHDIGNPCVQLALTYKPQRSGVKLSTTTCKIWNSLALSDLHPHLLISCLLGTWKHTDRLFIMGLNTLNEHIFFWGNND